jgi:hypothetical protein
MSQNNSKTLVEQEVYVKAEVEQSYYDQAGNEIMEGDLLRVWHFRGARRKVYYMYQIAVLIERKGKTYWGGKDYHVPENKNHYWLRAVANEETRQLMSALVVDCKDKMRELKRTVTPNK